MRNVFLGIALASLIPLTADQAQAGRRRCRVRQQCVPCVPYAPSMQPCCNPSGVQCAPTVLSYFPDVCPTVPQFQDENGIWTWDAERHYGEGLNCSNCLIEITTLVGNYDLYGNWPYPCGDANCEPSVNIVSRAVDYCGKRKNADNVPVTLAFDPISEMPAGTRAREIAPRRYISFDDRAGTSRKRFFIVYDIRVERMGKTHDTHFGHEVPEAELRSVSDKIRHVDRAQIAPLDKFGTPGNNHSHVYAVRNQDGRNEFVVYLKRD